MEKVRRKPFQGVFNIIRFNWHFYALLLLLVLGLLLSRVFFSELVHDAIGLACALLLFPIVVSLVVSFYVYDWSNLYSFEWMNALGIKSHHSILNVHAGYDETSEIISNRFPESTLLVADFYDAEKHTEVSIERARKAYPEFPGTQRIETTNIPFGKNSFDYIFLIFAAHEIRDNNERIFFLTQLQETLTANGVIVIMEHTRDLPNFLAYNIGFLHFWSETKWLQNFEAANLRVTKKFTHTPFVTIYILKRNGNTP